MGPITIPLRFLQLRDALYFGAGVPAALNLTEADYELQLQPETQTLVIRHRQTGRSRIAPWSAATCADPTDAVGVEKVPPAPAPTEVVWKDTSQPLTLKKALPKRRPNGA